jgi:hypothetical protein
MTQDTTQSVLFPGLFSKPISARFDQPDSSSDGGAILLKAIDTELDLMKRLAQCIQECRQEAKVLHPLFDLFRQRVYGIACGYPDCNDADRLADDPIQKLLLDRDPIDGYDRSKRTTAQTSHPLQIKTHVLGSLSGYDSQFPLQCQAENLPSLHMTSRSKADFDGVPARGRETKLRIEGGYAEDLIFRYSQEAGYVINSFFRNVSHAALNALEDRDQIAFSPPVR